MSQSQMASEIIVPNHVEIFYKQLANIVDDIIGSVLAANGVPSVYGTWDYNNIIIAKGITLLGHLHKKDRWSSYSDNLIDKYYNLLEGSTDHNEIWVQHAIDPKEIWHCGLVSLASQRGNKEVKIFDEFLKNTWHTKEHFPARKKKNYNNQIAVQIDDIFMTVPFYMSNYKFGKGESFLTKAIEEIFYYHKKLWCEEKKLHRCLWLEEENRQAAQFWGRGNGWIVMALVWLLDELSETHPDYGKLALLLEKTLDGLCTYQDSDGMWHQLIDDPNSYAETSGSAMFTYAMLVAERKLIGKGKYYSASRKGVHSLLGYIESSGRIRNVCAATDMSDDNQYYLIRPHEESGRHALGLYLLIAYEEIFTVLRREGSISELFIQ